MGRKHFTKDGYVRASKHFDSSLQDNDLKGKVCVITGASSGLGLKAAEEFARRGCKLYLACRNANKGAEAVEHVVKATGNQDVHLKICDLASLASIRQFSLSFGQEPLHILVNNAGAMYEKKCLTVEGHDMSFGVNTLGTFALTLGLEPALRRAKGAKVIFVSSGGMYTEGLEVCDLENLGKYDGVSAYAKDKRRQVAIAEKLAEMWKDRGIHVYSMHPGWTDTEGLRASMPKFHETFKNKLRDLSQGVDTIVWLALQDDPTLEPGGFYLDRRPQAKHLGLATTRYKPKDVDNLWEKLLKMSKTGEEEADRQVVAEVVTDMFTHVIVKEMVEGMFKRLTARTAQEGAGRVVV